ncbi:MAG: TIGR02710 family CRISPR-associated protein [Deltaproteobacteria bacterium]|nr:MAG: TIGR02710 family CRISPR-associated protein [Deltaproteobacteria bacterium]
MFKKALVLTVGTGTRPDVNIVLPLIKTVKDSRPDHVVFVVTKLSQEYAQAIAQDLALEPSTFDIKVLVNFDDVQAVFMEVNRLLRQLLEQGFSPADIQVDFTSGTKAMSAGAVLAAVYQGCQSLKYITGERDHGVVKNGTERFVSFCPNAIFANQEIKIAVELIKQLRFIPACEILDNLNPNLLADHELDLVANLQRVAQAYDFWDHFEHLKFSGTAKKVKWHLHELQQFQPSEDVVRQVHGLGLLLQNDQNVANELVIVDLFNNAKRRAREGRYDDGLARLYRLAEMLAQHILASRHKIITANVDLAHVPAAMHPIMAAHRDPDTGQIKIGLRIAYRLLEALNEEVGKKYISDKRLTHLLNERNHTILAHGNKPATAGLYQKLEKSIVELVTLQITDFISKCQKFNFPWLRQPDSDGN